MGDSAAFRLRGRLDSDTAQEGGRWVWESLALVAIWTASPRALGWRLGRKDMFGVT